MKKLLLTGVAALALASSAAHTRPMSQEPQCRYFPQGTMCQHLLQIEARQQQEQAQLQAMQKKAEEERKVRETYERLPSTKLKNAYFSYQFVQACYEARQGYQWVWINDIELDRAREAITSIEQNFLRLDPNLNTFALYQDAAAKSSSIRQYVDGSGCRAHYQSLLAKAPVPPLVKDFGKDAVKGE